jgi:hypothetical protein
MRHAIAGFGLLTSLTAFCAQESDTYSLTVKAFDLRNTKELFNLPCMTKMAHFQMKSLRTASKYLGEK